MDRVYLIILRLFSPIATILNFMLTFNMADVSIVQVRDGGGEDSPSLGRHCGNTVPPKILSNGNMLWIRFKTDIINVGTGFKARYISSIYLF